MLVGIGLETFAKEVTDMTKDDDKDVTDVCREEDIVWWVLFVDNLHGLSKGMARREPECFVSAVTKLGVHGRKNLFGGGGNAWVGKAIFVIFRLVQNSIF